jgi:ketosteroid isomerase-like protein
MGANICNIDRDGETRTFAAHGHAELASAGGLTLLKGTFEPGWRWSTDVAPLAGTKSCQVRHLGYVVSGRMQVQMDDGTMTTVEGGDLFDLPAGHDAWVLGSEPCIMVDYSADATRYATRGTTTAADDTCMSLVRKGYAAFNSGDIETLKSVLSHDVVQHVPGTSRVAGGYKGIDAVLGYYGTLAEMTGGTFRADLINVFGDGQGHVTSVHQITATINGTTRVSRGGILFTFLGERATDLLELREDLPGDDAFFA